MWCTNSIMSSPITRIDKTFWFLVILIVNFSVSAVKTVPNERQAQELLLLDSLGKKGGWSSDQGTLMEMLGRSKYISF